MKKGILLFLLYGCMVVTMVKSQEITPLQLKSARNSVYEWLEKYNVYARCEGRGAVDNFYSLFQSTESLVFNDYLPMTDYNFSNPQMAVSDYVKIIRNQSSGFLMKYELADGRIVDERNVNGKLQYTIRFIKNVWFVERNNFSEDRFEYPTFSFDLEAQLEYDPVLDQMKASALENTKDIDPFVILHEGRENTVTKISKIETLCQSKSSQLIKYYPVISLFDDKVITLGCDTLKHHIGFGYAIGAESVNAPVSDGRFAEYSIHGGRQGSLWASFYQQLFISNLYRVGLEISLQYENSDFWANCNFDETYPAEDPDGGSYERIIRARDYQEHAHLRMIEIPITAKYEYLVNNQWSLFVKGGLSASYDIMQHADASGDMAYEGYYSWLFNVTMSQNGIYDFGQFSLTDNSADLGINKFRANGSLAIGACYYFMERWMVEAAFRYRATIWGKVNHDVDYHISNYDGDWTSLTYSLDSYKTSTFGFYLQLNYNF